MSWGNSEVSFVPFTKIVCVGGNRGRFPPWKAATQPAEAVFHGQTHRWAMACVTEHTPGCGALVGHSARTGNAISKGAKCDTIGGCRRGRRGEKTRSWKRSARGGCSRSPGPGVCVTPSLLITPLRTSFFSEGLTAFNVLSRADPPSRPSRCVSHMGAWMSGGALQVGGPLPGARAEPVPFGPHHCISQGRSLLAHPAPHHRLLPAVSPSTVRGTPGSPPQSLHPSFDISPVWKERCFPIPSCSLPRELLPPLSVGRANENARDGILGLATRIQSRLGRAVRGDRTAQARGLVHRAMQNVVWLRFCSLLCTKEHDIM